MILTMRVISLIASFLLVLNSFAQTKNNGSQAEFKILAKFLSYEGGDKVHISRFTSIANSNTKISTGEIISVGYYNYKMHDENLDTVLLILVDYPGQTQIKNYFICPDYDGKRGIQPAKIEFIGYDFWEGCETGSKACPQIKFARPTDKNWFLIMPCGGTQTHIEIRETKNSNLVRSIKLDNSCPPTLNLAELQNDQYSASMIACGLGGSVFFSLNQ
jgi:hypothetical protein